ncbi:YvrJ family protein [Bacillus lacus]|uniref:YvrJ family protein n=1 Tax=Metabacillus lacus TaxID=1983721 RepID=A0A7X2LYE7_9BACI|nr:YvrJ family protein [Metabacillus lacus]MRX72261.1 YvrJ family protein [Metabacillus lacus]
MEEWIKVISDTGFPVVVTLFLLHRVENKLDALNVSIQNIPVFLAREMK